MSLGSLDMIDREIEDALTFRADGGFSLQQLPYECPDSSFEHATDSDVLKPAVVYPYEPPLTKYMRERGQPERPTPVPNLEEVELFMFEPDFVDKQLAEFKALLTSEFIQNPFPFPGKTPLLDSYSSEPLESDHLENLREQAKHTLDHGWKYDPLRCSVKAAFEFDQDEIVTSSQGISKKEFRWIAKGKLTTAKNARRAARAELKQVQRSSKWFKHSHEENKIFNFNGSSTSQELEEFYGLDGTDLHPVDNKSPAEGGVSSCGGFHDSSISIDDGFKETTKMVVPSGGPTFKANIAPLRVPQKKGRWLGLVGDQKQRDWPGRRQGPYDVHGLRTWVRASKRNRVEIQDEAEASISAPENMAGSFTPQPIAGNTSVSRAVEASDGHDVGAASLRIPVALIDSEVRDADQMVDSPSIDALRNPLPAEVTPIESAESAQEVSGSIEGEVNNKSSEPKPQSTGQEQPQTLHSNSEKGKAVEIPEQLTAIVASNKDAENYNAPISAGLLVSQKRPQHFDGPAESGSDSETSSLAPRNISTTAFNTPVNQRTRQIQIIEAVTPPTPSTVYINLTPHINLTPEYDSDMDASDASDGSLEVGPPSSPTANTQTGQSAPSRYVQETESRPSLPRHSSTTNSFDGSESEEVSLVPTPDRLSQLEGHAGFSKRVGVHQKQSGTLFALGNPKASQETSSSSKAAPIPVTPGNETDSDSFSPTTPHQLSTPTNLDRDSPGTPTPAPKGKGKSVMDVFKSSKLASRSPERAKPTPGIAGAPSTPAAGAGGQHRGSPFGGQGLLFHKAKKNEKDTKNVLNSLQLSPKPGNARSELAMLDEFEDELGHEGDVAMYKGGTPGRGTRSATKPHIDLGARGRGKEAAPRARVRSRADDDDGAESSEAEEAPPKKKKTRRSTRAKGGKDVEPFPED